MIGILDAKILVAIKALDRSLRRSKHRNLLLPLNGRDVRVVTVACYSTDSSLEVFSF